MEENNQEAGGNVVNIERSILNEFHVAAHQANISHSVIDTLDAHAESISIERSQIEQANVMSVETSFHATNIEAVTISDQSQVRLEDSGVGTINIEGSNVDISQANIGTVNYFVAAGEFGQGNAAGGEIDQMLYVEADSSIKAPSKSEPSHKDSDLECFFDTCNKEIKSNWEGLVEVTKDYKGLVHEPEKESSSKFEINRKFFEGKLGAREVQLTKENASNFQRDAESSRESFEYEKLKETLLQSEEKRISIIGTAGAGKSILTKRLLRDLSQSNDRSQLLVFNNFRDFPDSETVTPVELLFGGLFRDKSVANAGYDWLLENQSKVIFIFDGLDQVSWKIDPDAKLVRPYSEGKTSDIMSNIFNGKLLPNVKLVYTSREHTVASLQGKCRPQLVIAMTGLSEDDVKSLFISLVGDNGEELWRKLVIKSHYLIPLLSTPAFLIFAAIVYKSNPDNPPEFVTGLMLEIIDLFKRSVHITKKNMKKVMKGLEKMSFTGLTKKTVLFLIEHIQEAGLDLDDIKDWMIKFPGKNKLNQFLVEGEEIIFFTHQSLQEILGGSYVSKLPLKEFKEIVLEYLSDDFWTLTLKFISGILLNKETDEYRATISNIDEKQEALKEMLRIKYKSAENTTQMLSVLAAISESNDNEFIRSVVTRIKMYNYPISGTGVHVIGVLLRHCHRLEEITLQGCSLNKAVGSILWQIIKNYDVQTKAVNLSSNKLTRKIMYAVGKVIENDGRLDLLDCSLTSNGLECVKAELGFKKVLNLNLSKNNLTDDCLSVVGEIVQDHGHLELQYCSLTSCKLKSLKTALGDKKLERLDLRNNTLSDDASLALVGYIIQNNGQLGFENCSLTESALESLKTALGDKMVNNLDLTMNDMSDKSLSAVGHFIQNSGELNLTSCSVTISGIQHLKTSLGDKKLRKLNLSYNTFDGEMLTFVGHIIQHDGHLEMQSCWLNSCKLEFLKKGLGDKKIRELNLSFNIGLDEAAFPAVAHIIQNNGVLRVQGWPGVSSDLERLKTLLDNKKVTILEGGHKELSDRTLPELMRNIGSNGYLELRQYSLTIDGFELLKTELGDKKVKHLALDGNTLSNEIISIVGQIIQNDGGLSMQSCPLTSRCLECLKTALGDKKLLLLQLWFNNNIDQSLDAVGFIMADQSQLELVACKITNSGLERLTDGLGTKQVSELNISLNTIGHEMASTLGKITKELKIKRLEMWECSLTDGTLNNFLFEAAGSELSFLDLKKNYLTQSAVVQIGQTISVKKIEVADQRRAVPVMSDLVNFGFNQPPQASGDKTRQSTSVRAAEINQSERQSGTITLRPNLDNVDIDQPQPADEAQIGQSANAEEIDDAEQREEGTRGRKKRRKKNA